MYAYLELSSILLGIWALVYVARASVRRKMLVVSAWTSLLGLTEPIFVPAYWHPPTLFDLAERTGFDLESLLFAFSAGGLASALYDVLIGLPTAPIRGHERLALHHRWHRWALLCPVPVFILLYALTSLNAIHISNLALLAGGCATLACRPDLWRRMAASAGFFVALYVVYFVPLMATHPGYVQAVWNFPALSGVLVFGIPLEELLFADAFGWMWSSVYEHLAWTREIDLGAGRVHSGPQV